MSLRGKLRPNWIAKISQLAAMRTSRQTGELTQLQPTIAPSDSFEYYTDAVYWNNFPQVQAHLNRIATGDSTKGWMELLRVYSPAEKLLSLNCGNGWVERDFFRLGLAKSIIGVDISAPLLDEARRLAQVEQIDAEYRVMDANNPTLTNLGFDCVLNHAALHHVAYIDRLVREILINLPEHGLLINYDFIGPQRNQYPWEQWSQVVELWGQLPPELRTDLKYPHLRTMLYTDPTEAVHSELIVPILRRYFDVIVQRALGGAIAYPLLWNNTALYRALNTAEATHWLQKIIDADAAYTDGKLENSYFAVLICRPKKDALNDDHRLAAWTREEEEREERARTNGGRYGPRGALEIIYDRS